MASLDNVQSRKWIITINNPLEHGLDHSTIIEKLRTVRGKSIYWCLCDEEGDECETLHTHIFLYRSSPFTAQQINNLFPNCHRDKGYGTVQEIRDYIRKEGDKFQKDGDGSYDYVDTTGKRHKGINYIHTFEEYGKIPDEHQGKSAASELIVSLIREGASNQEIVDTVNSAYKDLEKIERVRSMYRDAKFADSWRDLQVTYIFGKTGSGKTRSVMETYGYRNVYRVTDYKHPFDNYDGQDVVIFEEFRGGLKHGDMLNYLDGYPLLLPCRYFNRQACFTKVFIITNIPPDEQYTNVDKESRMAFYRRIHKVEHRQEGGRITIYDGVESYIRRHAWADDIKPDEQITML